MANNHQERVCDKVLRLLRENPQGLSVDNLMKTLGYTRHGTLHSQIHYLRSNRNCRSKIICSEGIYKFVIKSHPPVPAGKKPAMPSSHPPVPAGKKPAMPPSHPPVPAGKKPALLPINDLPLNATLIAKLKTLPPSDAKDIIDFFKKAFFYNKCAMALIEACDNASNLHSSLTSDIISTMEH